MLLVNWNGRRYNRKLADAIFRRLLSLLLVRAADDELRSQVLLLLRRPLTDAQHDVPGCEVGTEQVAEALVVARLLAEDAKPTFIRLFRVVLAAQRGRVGSEPSRSNFHLEVCLGGRRFLGPGKWIGGRVDDPAPDGRVRIPLNSNERSSMLLEQDFLLGRSSRLLLPGNPGISVQIDRNILRVRSRFSGFLRLNIRRRLLIRLGGGVLCGRGRGFDARLGWF